jgi:thiol-disulfide isomerase/thioredoxin
MSIPLSLCALLALSTCLVGQDPKPTPPDRPAPKPAPETKPEEPKVVKLGDALPKGIVARGIDTKQVDFDALKGKVIVLHFWSTTCPYEVAAEPKLNALSAEFADKGVVVMGIASNAGEIGEQPAPEAFETKDADKLPYAPLRKKAAESKVNHTIVVDHGARIGQLLQGKTTPHCFVFDQKGVLQYEGALDDDPSGKKDEVAQYVRDAVTAVLAGDKPAVPSTKPYG